MTRAFTDVSSIQHDFDEAVKTLRDAMPVVDGSPVDLALCSIETFGAVALRVMTKTNPSKVRSEARNVELQARLDGVPVLRSAR